MEAKWREKKRLKQREKSGNECIIEYGIETAAQFEMAATKKRNSMVYNNVSTMQVNLYLRYTLLNGIFVQNRIFMQSEVNIL